MYRPVRRYLDLLRVDHPRSSSRLHVDSRDLIEREYYRTLDYRTTIGSRVDLVPVLTLHVDLRYMYTCTRTCSTCILYIYRDLLQMYVIVEYLHVPRYSRSTGSTSTGRHGTGLCSRSIGTVHVLVLVRCYM